MLRACTISRIHYDSIMTLCFWLETAQMKSAKETENRLEESTVRNMLFVVIRPFFTIVTLYQVPTLVKKVRKK